MTQTVSNNYALTELFIGRLGWTIITPWTPAFPSSSTLASIDIVFSNNALLYKVFYPYYTAFLPQHALHKTRRSL